MKSLDFKSAMNQLKEQKNKTAIENGKKFVRYSDVIKEKIKENKVEKTILKNFDELEREREEWIKMRNITMNKEKDNNYLIADESNKTNPSGNQEKTPKTEEKPGEGNFAQKIPEIIEDNSKTKVILEEENNNNEIKTYEPEKEDSDILKKMENKKEWKITVDPKTIITEINDDLEKKRIINVDKYTSEFKCDELYNWFHLMFISWEKELDNIPENMRDSAEGRQKFGIYKQCRGYIKPLLRILKKKEISKEIMNKLFEIMIFCLDKDYIRAHDKYIELAIGNAPWPMGVTMVGIHERTGRARIAKSQVAHILNDENTKKYLQSVKRIMSLVQRLNPTSPSQSVFS
jgi:pre-mRNA-splicing factor 18